MNVTRDLIVELFKIGKTSGEIFKDLKVTNVGLRMIQRTIKRYKETGSSRIRENKENINFVRTPEMVKRVRERIQRNPAQSVNKMAIDLGISKSRAHNIVHSNLGLKAYKKQKIHGLTAVQKKPCTYKEHCEQKSRKNFYA